MRTILKTFRRRFIAVTMALIGVITLVVFVAIVFVNANDFKSQVTQALDRAMSSQPYEMPELGQANDDDRRSDRIPVYSVDVFADGTILSGSNSTAQMSESTLEKVVEQVLDSDATSGRLSKYNLFYRCSATAIGTHIAFADASSYITNIRVMVIPLAGAWVLLMIVLFWVVFFLSKVIVRPVQEAWDKQQRFVADASHELKTPLTVILADTSILKASPEKSLAQQSEWVDSIAAEAERMQNLTEELLTLAQADAGVDISAAMSRVDLSNMCMRSALQYEAVAFESGIEIDCQVDSGLFVNAVSDKLEGALKTLLENACKYGRKDGKVTLGLHGNRGNVVLTVADDGQGIPEEDLPHVFDRFYKSDKSRTNDGPSQSASFGLGLSIAKANIEMNGGTITVGNANPGTVFTVTLPAAPAPLPA